jgi:3-oxoacyl-[acyl-carrier-protein] synthase II
VSEPIWITGIGAATPLGHTYAEIADNLLDGKSGIRRVTRFPVTDHPSQIAGMVSDVRRPEGVSATEFAALRPLDRLGLWCGSEALRDSGWYERRAQTRIGLVLGTATEWFCEWETDGLIGGKRIFEPHDDAVPLVHRLRRRLDLTGPAVSLSAACASGNYALALARRWLELGWVDVCLAGACDLGVTPMLLAGFGNLRALSRRNDDPTGASRPFDRDRDGFVMGEGAALFVLESAASARRRSARAYARLAGCGASSDAYHMVIPSPDPEPAIAAMRQALADAQLNPADIDYINAHATSTTVGDIAEARVLETVFGSAVRNIPVSSTKSMTGHLLTAAAAVEALACIIAMERQAIPPTINLDNIDPECNLCHVPKQARAHRVRAAVSNSFGFGGSNTCVLLTAA